MLVRLTARLPVSRQTFAAFYDNWLAEASPPDAPAGFLHAVVTTWAAVRHALPTLDPANDSDALALALAALADRDRILDCFGAAVGLSMFDEAYAGHPPDAARPLIMGLAQDALGHKSRLSMGRRPEPTPAQPAAAQPARAQLHAAGFHKMTSPETIWTDPGDLLPALLLARRRICIIYTRDENENVKHTGTGFLIGPSAVLTNWHVVEDMAAQPVLSDPSQIEVRFDYSPTTGLETDDASAHSPPADKTWCVASSPYGPTQPDAAVPYWWTVKTARDGWRDSVKTSLDYAVIRLATAPGLQRGWYDLTKLNDSSQSLGCWVLHHPSSLGHTVTEGQIYYRKKNVARIFHSASTVRGSSGGLALSAEGTPIGLHHLGLGDDPHGGQTPTPTAPANVINCAVSLSFIAQDLQAKRTLETISQSTGILPFRGCLDGVRPVFGRKALFSDLKELFEGTRPVMRVHVSKSVADVTQPGKSFTIELIQNLFRPPDHHHIVFKAAELHVDALRQTEAVLGSFAPDLLAGLPREPDTTTPAYVARLVNYLGTAIRDRLGNKTVWLMIDDLDKHELSDASGREFLATLYSQVGLLPNLRIVLIGLRSSISIGGLDPADVIENAIAPTDLTDVGQLFADWLKERGGRDVAMDEKTLSLLSKTVASYAGTQSPMPKVAEFISTYMQDVVDELFGAAAQGDPVDGGGP
ncbi:serine protease [Roseovarius sp. M141]|uniref:trypsin-like serine peptidase n=1 Tax=Roseovarius sp. M141 TaxID=2583806 RepID=UPI0020CE46F0|nr:trypsin-like peptidase domain-containing protein [Roseovarius sp. M141]